MRASTQKSALLVEDGHSSRNAFEQALAASNGTAWNVLSSPSLAEARALLSQGQPDLVLLNLPVPEAELLEFLELARRRNPRALLVVLLDDATADFRATCLGIGVASLMERPRDNAGWQAVCALIQELVRHGGDNGPHETPAARPLQDVLQRECLSRNACVLEIRGGKQPGVVFLKEGRILHAECGQLAGEAALSALLAMRSLEYESKPFAEPAAQTITAPWESLLIEAARAVAQQHDSDDNSQSTIAHETPFAKVDLGEAASRIQTVVPIIESRPETFQALVTEGDSARVSDAKDPIPQVEELIVCSLQGEILHGWNYANQPGRVGLLEYVSGKGRQLEQHLPLGEFDRLEARNPDTHVIIRVQPGHATFVRVARSETAGRRSGMGPVDGRQA